MMSQAKKLLNVVESEAEAPAKRTKLERLALKLKKVEGKAKGLQDKLSDVSLEWEKTRDEIEAEGGVVDYSWGDVLA